MNGTGTTKKIIKMNSRDKILHAVLNSQPSLMPLPDLSNFEGFYENTADQFISVLTAIGGRGVKVSTWQQVKEDVLQAHPDVKRVVTLAPELEGGQFESLAGGADAHLLENVYLAVVKAHFAVAENGAVWLTEDLMGLRVLPFICEHLAVVVSAKDILPTMHEAYKNIGADSYGFAAFIAGPSKTADIEQSLVLGAHGPRSMTVYLMD